MERPIDAGILQDNLTDIYGDGNRLVYLKDVLDLIDEQPTLTHPNEWVSVEERLPEGNGEYIVTACDEGCPVGEGIWYDTVVVFAEYYDGCWTWNDGTEYDLTDIITHWMPLPAPPDRRPPEGEKK